MRGDRPGRTDGGGARWWLLLGSPLAIGAVALTLVTLGLVGARGATTANANSQSTGCGGNSSSAAAAASGSAGPAGTGPTSQMSGGDMSAAISSAAAAATGTPLPSTARAALQAAGGYSLAAVQVQSAQLIVAVAKGMRLDERAMRAALVASYESSVLDPAPPTYSSGGETAGLFGQWFTDYPGVNLTDPVQSVTSFYDHLRRLPAYRDPARSVGEVAAAATAPHGKPAASYAARERWASAVVALLDTGDTAAVSATGSSGTGVDCITGAVTGPVPGLTPAQATNAALIVRVAATRRLPQVAAQIGVAVAIAESALLNYANDGASTDLGYFADGHRQLNASERLLAQQSMGFAHDAVGHNLDSIGLFQQRPSAGWGTPAELIDPAVSAGKFYDALGKVAGWQAMSPWTAAQTVQGSNDSGGGIYRAAYNQAVSIVTALTTAPQGPGGHGGPGGPGGPGGVVVVDGPRITLPARTGVVGTVTAPNAAVAKAISAGLSWLGEPHSWGGGGPAGPTAGICGPNGAVNDCHIVGFDCSGLMQYQWAQVGITLDHFSQDQWAAGQQIPYASSLPGDMIGYPGHIAMFLGTLDSSGLDYMLEAPQSGQDVHLTPVRPGFYATASRVWVGTT